MYDREDRCCTGLDNFDSASVVLVPSVPVQLHALRASTASPPSPWVRRIDRSISRSIMEAAAVPRCALCVSECVGYGSSAMGARRLKMTKTCCGP